MGNTSILYLACILAGFALMKVATVSFLAGAGLTSFVTGLGTLVVVVFALGLLYYGVKALLNK